MTQHDALPESVAPLPLPSSSSTRLRAAHAAHAQATEDVQHLATRLDTAFARLELARERMEDEGVEAEVRMPQWMSSAFTVWKTARADGERRQESERRMAAARAASVLPSTFMPDPRD